MSGRALLIEVRWPDGRFHGVRDTRERTSGGDAFVPEWPPSPFRLFQALVAGAYGGRWAAEAREGKDAAFEWLERLNPPVISAPSGKTLRPVTYYVPNNDLDTKEGDPDRLNEIRASKTLHGSVFDSDRPAAYLWTFDGDDAPATAMAALAGRLHTLGHGIDAAFAHAEVMDAAAGEARILALGGAPRRPSVGAPPGPAGVPCPDRGSLESLRRRHDAFTGRLARVGEGRRTATQFRQPMKSHARAVAYERSPVRLLYELKPLDGVARFRSWPLKDAAGLVVAVRDQAARALASAWPMEVDRFVIGRGAGSNDAGLRLRILPLPSIGMRHTDPDIRRVLVEIPPDHPIPIADIDWALAGRELANTDGEPLGIVLAPTSDRSMLRHYGVGEGRIASRLWRSVTPVVLPADQGRRSGGSVRASAEARAAGAVVNAARHAGITTAVEAVRVQREPFDLRGERADRFSPDRLDPRGLCHVEVRFAEPVRGPLALGDGRWLGLGVMQPVLEPPGMRGLHLFTIQGGSTFRREDTQAICRALRNAVMARAQMVAGRRLAKRENLPTFFTGHAEGPDAPRHTGPARSGSHEHLFFAADPDDDGRPARLAVIAPHLADRSVRMGGGAAGRLAWLADAVDGLTDLRASRLGRFDLAPASPESGDRLFGSGKVWSSQTPYHPTRHPHHGENVEDVVRADLQREAERRGLPRPVVEVLALDEGPRGGLRVRLKLTFAVSVAGPILLGKDSHFGAGLFFGCVHHGEGITSSIAGDNLRLR